jgi:spermidine synthase
MISPVVVKLAVQRLETAGGVVGKIYAVSTLGSILGTFATGFYLIEMMGTRTLLYSVGALLICCAPIFGGLLAGRNGRPGVVGASLVLMLTTLGLLWTFRGDIAIALEANETEDGGYTIDQWGQTYTNKFYKESNYFTIKWYDEDHEHFDTAELVPLRTLVLDRLVHSYTHMEDPTYLQYGYLRIYEELVAWRSQKIGEAHRSLFIGGGGYTLPRYLDHRYSKAHIDVVEIDPWVTRVAEKDLGIKDTRVKSYNEDGRWFAMNCKDQYDFIFGDAFNDLSIPYHLTTKEFNENLKRLLKPDGLLMALVIDHVGHGKFLPAYIQTLYTVFGPDNVDLITLGSEDLDKSGTDTVIVVASTSNTDMKDFRAFLDKRKADARRVDSIVTERARLQRYITDRQPITLTDDYVPVDNLIAPHFEERYGLRKK